MLDLVTLSEDRFTQLWREEIEPLLTATEAERLAAKRERGRRLRLGLPIAAVVGAAVGLAFSALGPGLVVGGMGALIAWGIAEQPLRRVQRKAKHQALQAIAQAIGVIYRPNQRPDDVVERFRRLTLLPSCDRESFDDWFHGERLGCGFDLFEGHMEQRTKTKDGESWSTVFRGQIIRLTFPRQFQGVTLVQRDWGVFNALGGIGRGLSRVQFADPAFERKFEVRSTDQVEARVLVHPVFAERLLQLEQQLRGARLRCGFQGGDLLIALESGDRYEIGSMGDTLVNPGRVRTIIQDLAAILRLMDAVLTTEQASLLRHQQNRPPPA